MGRDDLDLVGTTKSVDQRISDALNKLNSLFEIEQEAENDLQALRATNLEKFVAAQKNAYTQVAKFKEEEDNKYFDRLLKKGIDAKKLQVLEDSKIERDKALIQAAYEKKQGTLTGKAYRKRIKEIKQEEKAKYDAWLSTLTKKEKRQAQSAKREEQRLKRLEGYQNRNAAASAMATGVFGSGQSLGARTQALKEGISKGGWGALVGAIANLAQQLDKTVEDIARSQSAIDTRLQGWGGKTRKTSTGGNSYWAAMSTDITKNIGSSTLVKQEDVVSNLKTMVGKGIAFNVEERAFLQTVKEKIADTFDATQTSLLKLVRIQQQDTTAARLGMESALTSFLNNMYETTEYMTEMAEQVKNNIYEASALMSAKSATEFEYQIQKWMGSLYSVGFGTDLSSALGGLAAGNISSISEGGVGNLMVMAANRANLSIADILADGLDASETNQLMQAMVEYLGQIYSETKGSNVLAQQYASVFGLKASDLKAAANLAKSTGAIAGTNLNYGGMMTQLTNMANTMYQRTSIGELLSNAWSNTQYSIAAGIANSPALYAINKISTLLKDTTGGIDFSLPLYMGTGTAQTFNVADIMKVAALSGSVLSNMGSMLGGLFNTGGGLLEKFGINGGTTTVSRGTGKGLLTTSGRTTSESGYTANSESSDITSKAMTDTTDEQNQKISATSEENEEATMTDVNESVLKIYELLTEITTGGKVMHVDIDGVASFSTIGPAGLSETIGIF